MIRWKKLVIFQAPMELNQELFISLKKNLIKSLVMLIIDIKETNDEQKIGRKKSFCNLSWL